MVTSQIALTSFVDVFDREDLFEILDNDRVLELSRLGGNGFSAVSALRRSTGIEQRRILRPGIAPIDVATAVANELQATLNFSWEDCPAVLLCHSHVRPEAATSLASELADELGVPRTRVHGYNSGCAGFLKLVSEGADIARMSEPGKHIPLISVEVPEEWHDAADKAFCGIVSAGATATSVWRGPGHKLVSRQVSEVHVPAEARHDGRALFSTELCEGFDFRGQPLVREVMHMDSESVFINGVNLMLDACRQAWESAGSDETSRVLAIPHQPSGKLLRTLISAARQDLPRVRILNNLPGFGNTLSSTIPTALSRLDDVTFRNEVPMPARGDLILLPAAGICMRHRADHMTQGYAVLSW